MDTSEGLKFFALDLHVHTPASSDYKKQDTSAEELVNTAISKGLRGIAITDHNTGSWIDAVKGAALGKKLVVFPGVEIKVHGGKSGVHLIVLFDAQKTSEHVKAFLNTIGLYEHTGDSQHIADITTASLAKKLQEFDSTAILILAHCTSSQGALSDMRGEQRSDIFRAEHWCLLGAEAPESDFRDPNKIEKGTRVYDLLDGGYEDFHRKTMGVYQASDAHAPDDIGSRFSYFKLDEGGQISIEDLRQCFIDREMRITQSFDYKKHSYPFVESMIISSGFLSGQSLQFRRGLNSILGAKGSGKSLASSCFGTSKLTIWGFYLDEWIKKWPIPFATNLHEQNRRSRP